MILLLALGETAILMLACRSLGRYLIPKHLNLESQALHFALHTASGLAVFSTLIFTLVSFHALSALALNILLVVLALLALLEMVSWRKMPSLPPIEPAAFLFFAAGLILFTALAALPSVSRDELIYHLEVPRRILLEQGWPEFHDNILAYFPLMTEMIFVFNLGTAGETAAHLTHGIFGLLSAAALYGFSRRYLSAQHALLALVIFLTVPTVVEILPIAYVDMAFTLYSFLSLVCLMVYIEKKERVLLIVSAVMAGVAAAVKFTGIQLAVIYTAILWVTALRPLSPEGAPFRTGRLIADAVFFVGVSMLLPLPYLIRNYLQTGWPLCPFQTLGLPLHQGFNWDPERSQMCLAWLSQFGTPLGQETALHTLLAPVRIFIFGKFNSPQFYEGVIGPIFLLAPAVTFFKKKDFKIKVVMLFSILFMYYWALTTKQARFLVPVLPWLSFLIACGVSSVRGPILKLAVAAGIMWNVWAGVQFWAVKNPVRYWLGKESKDNYLQRQAPHFAAYQAINAKLQRKDKVYLVNLKNYGYWLNKPWTSDFVFERYSLDQRLRMLPTDTELDDFFRGRGITHLAMDFAFLTSPSWGMEKTQLDHFLRYLKNHSDVIWEQAPFVLVKLR